MGNSSFKIGNISTEKYQKDFYSDNFSHYLLFACNYIPDEEVSKDIVQDVFINYWKQQDNFEDELSVKSFLYKSIRNACLNHLRHQNIRSQYFSALPEDWESEDFFMENVVRDEVSRIILDELAKLSEAGRQVILRSLEGLSNEEIAEELKISVNTVKTHKVRSYATLRKNLEYLRIMLYFISNSTL